MQLNHMRTTSINKNHSAQTTAVLVAYEPEMSVLQESLHLIQPQVGQIILVDNGSLTVDVAASLSQQGFEHIQVVALPQNLGIAFAQNRGIELAQSKGAQFVLLMDQDSLPADDMVISLHTALIEFPDAAAVGPVYQSHHQAASATFTQQIGWRRIQQICDVEHPVVPTEALIASGSLVPMAAFELVGNMNEGLFIDYVDTEWCLRAKSMGRLCYAVWPAKMTHHLGDHVVHLLGQKTIVHSPLRRYYQYRNAILLYKMKHITWGWKLADAMRMASRAVVYALTNTPRMQNIKMMAKGCWHGLLGKEGAFK